MAFSLNLLIIKAVSAAIFLVVLFDLGIFFGLLFWFFSGSGSSCCLKSLLSNSAGKPSGFSCCSNLLSSSVSDGVSIIMAAIFWGFLRGVLMIILLISSGLSASKLSKGMIILWAAISMFSAESIAEIP